MRTPPPRRGSPPAWCRPPPGGSPRRRGRTPVRVPLSPPASPGPRPPSSRFLGPAFRRSPTRPAPPGGYGVIFTVEASMPEVSLLVRVAMLVFIGALAAVIVLYHVWLDRYLQRRGRQAATPGTGPVGERRSVGNQRSGVSR